MKAFDIPDSVVAGVIAGAVNQETITSLWSSFIPPRSTPDETLRNAYAPGYTPPELLSKTVVFPGQEMPGADYTILSQLGEGGMGVVFEARQNHLNRNVALKMIRPERAGDPLARNCFFYEAVITAGLEHPGIVPILEFGQTHDGRDFYAMKRATGMPWSRVIREKSLEENLAIFERVADVVAYAHAVGIIHRDLKPANVLLGNYGEVWAGDWGVAVARSRDGDFLHAFPGGTPQYMPPEMALCDFAQQDVRSDIYLLGAILFEILTGRPPHPNKSSLGALIDAASNTIADIDTTNALLPVALKAMQTFPAHRYRTVQALKDAIRKSQSESEGEHLTKRADGQLAEAQRLGEYDLFRQVLIEYDAALSAHPGSTRAQKGKRRAFLSYARQALANGEFDLAASIIKPESSSNPEAASLLKEIAHKKTLANRLRRRRAVANAVLGLAVFALLMTGAYVIYNRHQIVADYVRPRNTTDNHYFGNLRGALNRLKHNAQTARLARGHSERLWESYGDLLKVIDDCERQFFDEPWHSPSTMSRITIYIHDRLPEMEKSIREIREIGRTASDPQIQIQTEHTVRVFADMVRHLNAIWHLRE